MKICNRCGQSTEVDSIGYALVWFVCRVCRLDNNDIHYGHDLTVEAMEFQSPEALGGRLVDKKPVKKTLYVSVFNQMEKKRVAEGGC